jgi:hypothetical protein
MSPERDRCLPAIVRLWVRRFQTIHWREVTFTTESGNQRRAVGCRNWAIIWTHALHNQYSLAAGAGVHSTSRTSNRRLMFDDD